MSYEDDYNIESAWDRIVLYLLIAAVIGAVYLAASGCTEQPPKPSPLKLCAQALVVLGEAAECTMLTPNICIFTEGDMERIHAAGADKQNYCPRLQPGQEEANQ